MAVKVSVILPINNSAKYLSKAIDSVIAQTFTDWELLVVNEYGSKDGSADIVRVYAREDSRVKLVQNEERLGLAESLNEGFRLAEGEYLARLDADDIAHPDRFEKQVAFLDAHPEVGVCGTYQLHFGPKTDWVHMPPVTPEDMRAAQVFHCNVCHSTLMLRRSVFMDNGLFYDSSYYAVDFELWTRAILVTEFATIPEVLGEHRESVDNITGAKKTSPVEEDGRIVAAMLKRSLGIVLTEEQMRLFQGNPFLSADEQQRELMLRDLKKVLRKIYARNEEVKAFAPESLLNSIATEWDHAAHNTSRNWNGERLAKSIDEVFGTKKTAAAAGRSEAPAQTARPKSFKARIMGLLRRIYKSAAKDSVRDIQKKTASLSEQNSKETKKRIAALEAKVDKRIEHWTWERYGRIRKELESLKLALDDIQRPGVPYVPYRRGEKIRIGVLFQIPSCWPSLETVWEALQADERFEVKMYLYDEEQREAAQMAGARQFLINHDIPFVAVERYTFLNEDLHILIYQTPWDEAHRPCWLQTDVISQLGIRIAYVPYGLNYSASVWENFQFSDAKFKAYVWRVFTFSERMRFDHIVLSPRGGQNVVAVGHPKFDAIARKESYPLDPAVRKLAAGRKIVFLQMHFAEKEGNPSIPEADVHAYIEFLRRAEDYKEEFFFLARPHPKMLEYYEQNDMMEEAEELRTLFTGTENVYLYDAPDYRPALFAADCVVGDRSALLLEAAALDIPVLYMTNFYYKEKILPAVEPVFKSFYQGAFAYDICLFLDFVMRKGNDYKREERREAARTCLPPLDGMGGKRIVDAMAEAIYKEAENDA